jgi:hypothetical protein
MKIEMFDIPELKKKLLVQLTTEEFIAVLSDTLLLTMKHANQIGIESKEPELIFGLSGLKRLLNCSPVTAQRIKNSGKLTGCFYQVERKIVFDKAKVLAALKIDKR